MDRGIMRTGQAHLLQRVLFRLVTELLTRLLQDIAEVLLRADLDRCSFQRRIDHYHLRGHRVWYYPDAEAVVSAGLAPVSYTHLTLPTIYSV